MIKKIRYLPELVSYGGLRSIDAKQSPDVAQAMKYFKEFCLLVVSSIFVFNPTLKSKHTQTMKALINAQIFDGTSTQALQNQAIIIDNKQILGLVPQNSLPTDMPIHDCLGQFVAPAFIDLQIYGGGGSLFNTEISEETIHKTITEQRQFGTAQLQITLSTVPLEDMLKAIAVCKSYQANHAGLLGLHLEGPYFSLEKRGAHLAKYVKKPTIQELKTIINHSTGLQTYMTIAAEQIDDECLNLLINSHIHLSLGHSSATYKQAKKIFGQGINRVTHLFNAMTAFQSREPGIVGAAYDSDVYASIIADGIHCDFAAVGISKKIMGERLFLITDAVTQDTRGEYRFEFATDRFVNDQGTLSGSALNMMQAVRNCVEKIGIPLAEALKMASTYPAKVVKIDDRFGKIAQGYVAQMVVFDRDFAVSHVYG